MDRKSAYRGLEKDMQQVTSSCAACSVGCGLKLFTRDNQLIRIEGDWDAAETKGLLCVAGRFEPLDEVRRRAWTPMVKRDGRMWPATVDEALDAVAAKAKEGAVAAVTSSRVTNEGLKLFAKAFANADSVGCLTPVPGFMAEAEGTLLSLDESDFYVIVGTDLSVDHQVAGFAVKRNVTNRGARLIIVDDEANGMDNLAYKHLKADQIKEAIDLAKRAEIPTVIYGAGAGDVLPALRKALGDKAQYLGLVPGSNGRGTVAAGLNGGFKVNGAKTVFVLAADDTVDASLLDGVADDAFVVVQTSYESALTERADVILPCGTWTEKSGCFTNTEGREIAMTAAIQPPTGVQSDEEILKALAAKIG
jgi:predicted molibdopterin-dependent oxidoreductase YjgC